MTYPNKYFYFHSQFHNLSIIHVIRLICNILNGCDEKWTPFYLQAERGRGDKKRFLILIRPIYIFKKIEMRFPLDGPGDLQCMRRHFARKWSSFIKKKYPVNILRQSISREKGASGEANRYICSSNVSCVLTLRTGHGHFDPHKYQQKLTRLPCYTPSRFRSNIICKLRSGNGVPLYRGWNYYNDVFRTILHKNLSQLM